jgi:autotransporter-associated beta strand protein
MKRLNRMAFFVLILTAFSLWSAEFAAAQIVQVNNERAERHQRAGLSSDNNITLARAVRNSPSPSIVLTAPISWANTGTDWNAGASWTGGVAPGSGDIATFSSAATMQPNVTANTSVSGVSVTSSGYDITSSSSSIKLTLLSTDVTTAALGAINAASAVTFDTPLILGAAASSTQMFTAKSTLTLNGVISSTNSINLLLVDKGFVINGANTYTGTTTFSSAKTAVVIVGNNAAFGKSTLVFAGSGSTLTAGVDLTGANAIANALTFSGTGALIIKDSTFGVDFTGNVDLAGAARTITSDKTTAGLGIKFGGVISNDAGAGVTFNSKNNNTLFTLTGTNTYTGPTTITAAGGAGTGGVSVSSIKNSGVSGPLGAGSIISLGQRLVYTGTGETTNRTINLISGSGIIDQSGSGLLKFTSDTTALTGNKGLTLSGSTAGTGEFAGIIADPDAVSTTKVTKTGTGTWTLSGANTYSGGTTVNGGTLNVTAASTLGSGTGGLTVSNPNTGAGTDVVLNLNSAQTVGSLSGTVALPSSGTNTATINLLGASTILTVNQSTDTSYAGVLAGSGGLTKNGIGTLLLNGANTYTGLTAINEGTLGGTGSVAGALNIGDGVGAAGSAAISPGASVGTFTTSSTLTIAGDGRYVFQLDSNTSTADKIVANGVSLLSGADMSFADLGSTALTLGTTFIIIDNTSDGGPISGTFSNLADGGMVVIGLNTYEADYGGGDGNDLALIVVVPEPSTWAMFAFGAVLFFAVQRFRWARR